MSYELNAVLSLKERFLSLPFIKEKNKRIFDENWRKGENKNQTNT